MSKNIIMQQKTADGYEELYPKANGDGSVIVNNTTNQFLGGGSTVGDALEYLSKFGMYWWKKVEQVPTYGINSTKTASTVAQYGGTGTIYSAGVIYSNYPPSSSVEVNDSVTNKTYPFQCSATAKVDANGKITLGSVASGSYCYWETSHYNDDDGEGYNYRERVVTSLTAPFYVKTNNTIYYVTGSLYINYVWRYDSSGDVKYKQFHLSTQNGAIYIPESYISSYTTTTTYICSSDPNAYPDQGNTDSSGAQYWKVGQPWEFLPKLGKVETGYYTGTGSGNATLTFENAPQFVFISYKATTNGGFGSCIWCKDSSNGPYFVISSTGQANTITQSGNNLTFTYMNQNAVAYQYFAITQ